MKFVTIELMKPYNKKYGVFRYISDIEKETPKKYKVCTRNHKVGNYHTDFPLKEELNKIQFGNYYKKDSQDVTDIDLNISFVCEEENIEELSLYWKNELLKIAKDTLANRLKTLKELINDIDNIK